MCVQNCKEHKYGLYSNYINEENTSACDSTQLAIQYPCVLCIHACISPCPLLLQLQGEEFLCKQTRYATHDAWLNVNVAFDSIL